MIDFKNGSLFKLKKTEGSSVKEVQPLLIPNENVVGCYKTVRDLVVFTNLRIIAVNIQGITGKKKDFSTLPYSKIQAFSVETAGVIDLDSELELYFSGLGMVKFEFSGASDIVTIAQLISSKLL